jgi:cephalosporin-C deacetylase-like acetyl esterase
LHEILQHYPSFGPSQGQLPPGQTLPELIRMLSYYDPANLAPWIRCPTYVSLMVGDLTVHSMGGLAVYHQLTGLTPEQKGFYPGPSHFHAGSASGGKQFRAALDRLAGAPLP